MAAAECRVYAINPRVDGPVPGAAFDLGAKSDAGMRGCWLTWSARCRPVSPGRLGDSPAEEGIKVPAWVHLRLIWGA